MNPGAVMTLVEREMVRFVRQKNRVVGALLQPLVFWLLLGFGFQGSFRAGGGENYLEYAYPGIVVLSLLFTAIFSTISVIEDRREGFLQGVLVAPVSRTTIVLSKVLGGALLAVAQGALYLILAPAAGVPLTLASVPALLLIQFSIAFGLTALGFLIAWRLTSTQGFHAIMNVFLIPLWLLSGAFFPAAGAPDAMRAVMALNPLTYAMTAFRRVLYGQYGDDAHGLPGLALSLGVLFGFDALLLALAIAAARKRATPGT